MFNKTYGNKERKIPFRQYLVEKGGKSSFFYKKLTNFNCVPIASDFSQKALRIVLEKMPDNHLSETFFKI